MSQTNKVVKFDIERQRDRSLEAASQLYSLLMRARDCFLSIRNPTQDDLVEKHLLATLSRIDGARFEASHIIRCLRNTVICVAAGLIVSFADYGDAQVKDYLDSYYAVPYSAPAPSQQQYQQQTTQVYVEQNTVVVTPEPSYYYVPVYVDPIPPRRDLSPAPRWHMDGGHRR